MGTTEVERLVTRLIGDNSSLKRMLGESGRLIQSTAQTIEHHTDGIGAKAVAMGNLAAQGIMHVVEQVKDLAKETLAAYEAHEDAEIKLGAAIGAGGHAVESTLAAYHHFAEGISAVTKTGIVATQELLQTAESLGLTGKAAQLAAKEAIAIEGALGRSAEGSIRLTVALAEGHAEMLGRFIPAIRGIKDPTLQAAKAHEYLAKMFETTKAAAGTVSGQIAMYHKSVHALEAEIGGLLARGLLPFVRAGKSLVDWLRELDGHKILNAFGPFKPLLSETIALIGQVKRAAGDMLSFVESDASRMFHRIWNDLEWTRALIHSLFLGIRQEALEGMVAVEFFFQNWMKMAFMTAKVMEDVGDIMRLRLLNMVGLGNPQLEQQIQGRIARMIASMVKGWAQFRNERMADLFGKDAGKQFGAGFAGGAIPEINKVKQALDMRDAVEVGSAEAFTRIQKYLQGLAGETGVVAEAVQAVRKHAPAGMAGGPNQPRLKVHNPNGKLGPRVGGPLQFNQDMQAPWLRDRVADLEEAEIAAGRKPDRKKIQGQAQQEWLKAHPSPLKPGGEFNPFAVPLNDSVIAAMGIVAQRQAEQAGAAAAGVVGGGGAQSAGGEMMLLMKDLIKAVKENKPKDRRGNDVVEIRPIRLGGSSMA